MADEQKLENFIQAVYADAESEGSALERELKAKRDAYLEKADDELLEEIYEYVRGATKRIRAEAGNRVSQKIFEQKRELHRRRQALREEAVAAAREKVERYTETADYREALMRLALYAEKRLGGDDMVIYLRAEDMALAGKLGSAAHAAVKEGEVSLGGLVAVNPRRRLRLDLSYDSALEKAAEDFGELAGRS